MMRQEKKNILWAALGLYALFALFYFWLAAQIPYTDDDWDWGLPVGLEQLLTASINSRYAGNLMVVLLTRSVVLKTIVMGSVFFLLPWTMSRFLVREPGRTRLWVFVACNCLLLSMERLIWKQTYSWVAGFSNYCVSALLLMVYLWEVRSALDGVADRQRDTVPGCLWAFVLSAVMQLYLENMAIFMVLLSGFLCFLRLRQAGRPEKKYILLLLGNLLGLLIMFSSSVYGALWDTGSTVGGYREMIVGGSNGLLGSVARCVRQLMIHLIPKTWGNNTALCLVTLACLSWLLRENRAKKWLIAGNGILAALLLADAAGVFDALIGTIPAIVLRDVFSGVYFLGVTWQLILVFRDRKALLGKVLILWFSAPAVVLPLAAVSEASNRLFLTPLLFEILVALLLLLELRPCLSVRRIRAFAGGGLLACALLLTGHYGVVYHSIGQIHREQLRRVEEFRGSGETTLVLPAQKYEDYLWYSISNVSGEYRYDFFKEYYSLPPETTILIEPAR